MKTKTTFILVLALFSFLLCSNSTRTDEPKIVNIESITKDISLDNACALSNWNNVSENSCRCCLVKEKGIAKTSAQAIDTCLKKKQCNITLLSNIKKKEKAEKLSGAEFLIKLYKKSSIIHQVQIDPSFMNSDGNLKEEGVAKLLSTAYQSKKINKAAFLKDSCIQVKNIKKLGGYNTVQLFLVSTTCKQGEKQSFILKEPQNSVSEIISLQAIKNVPGISKIVSPKTEPGFPVIALPIEYLSYKDMHNTSHRLILMIAAPGKVFCDLFIQFRDAPTKQNQELLGRAFYVLGKELGNFQKRFMKPQLNKILTKTLTHGDFKCLNLIYDEGKGNFTFIDNETMQKSIPEGINVQDDIIKIFFIQFAGDQQEMAFVQSVDLKRWFDTTLINFIKGYSEAYPKGKRNQVIAELKDIFTTPRIPGVWFDAHTLAQIQKEYVKPIFDSFLKPTVQPKKIIS